MPNRLDTPLSSFPRSSQDISARSDPRHQD